MSDKFGQVTLKGKIYEKDVVVHTDGTITKREKKKSKHLKPLYGHTPLSEEELGFLPEEKPEVIYIGKGYQGALPITPEALKILEKYETVIALTPELLDKLKQENRRFIAIIHVTC